MALWSREEIHPYAKMMKSINDRCASDLDYKSICLEISKNMNEDMEVELTALPWVSGSWNVLYR